MGKMSLSYSLWLLRQYGVAASSMLQYEATYCTGDLSVGIEFDPEKALHPEKITEKLRDYTFKARADSQRGAAFMITKRHFMDKKNLSAYFLMSRNRNTTGLKSPPTMSLGDFKIGFGFNYQWK